MINNLIDLFALFSIAVPMTSSLVEKYISLHAAQH